MAYHTIFCLHNEHLQSIIQLVNNSSAVNRRFNCCRHKQVSEGTVKVLNIQSPELWHPWRAEDLSVPSSVTYVVVHCGTNNLDHVQPKTIVDGIIKIGKVFQENLAADVKIILTGLLPRDLDKSKQRNRILKVNSYLKKIL